MDRRSSRGTRLTGLAAAIAGAVVGAWLGFGAAEDFLALTTAIAGAVAAGNLTLIALDVCGAPELEQANARGRSAVAATS